MPHDNSTHFSMYNKDFQNQINEYLKIHEADNKRKRKNIIVAVGAGGIGCLFFLFIWNLLNVYLQAVFLASVMTVSYSLLIKYKGNNSVSTCCMIGGYIFFGLSLFQVNRMFHIEIFTTTSYLIWGIIGVFLVLLTKNGHLSTISILIMNLGLIQIGIEASFSYMIFGLSMVSSFLFLQQSFSKTANIIVGMTVLFQLTYLGFILDYGNSFFSVSCLIAYWMISFNGRGQKNKVVRKIIVGYAFTQQLLFVLFTGWYKTTFSLSWKQSLFILLLFMILTALLLLNQKNAEEHIKYVVIFLPFCLLGGFGITFSLLAITFYCLTQFRKEGYISSKDIKLSSFWLAILPFWLLFTKLAFLFLSFPVYLAFVLLFLLCVFLVLEQLKGFLFHTLVKKNMDKEDQR